MSCGTTRMPAPADNSTAAIALYQCGFMYGSRRRTIDQSCLLPKLKTRFRRPRKPTSLSACADRMSASSRSAEVCGIGVGFGSRVDLSFFDRPFFDFPFVDLPFVE